MSVEQGPIPKWLFTDKAGRPLGGGFMATKRDINRAQNKPVFSDPAAQFPYTNPVFFDQNGMQGPFYWLEDEAYYLEVFDELGNPQFTIEHYVPGIGGGGSVTVVQTTRNLISNGQFIYNIGQSANPIGVNFLSLAPSSCDLSWDKDCIFEKSNTAVTDHITFNVLSPGYTGYEATPIYELNYVCEAVNGGGETFKYIEFPIKNVRSLEGSAVVISLSAYSSSSSTIEISVVQVFGSGGAPSSAVETLIASQTLNNTPTRYDFTATIPSIGGKVIGTNLDDFLLLHINLPINEICNIKMTNIQIVTGNKPTPYIYETHDMVAQRLFKPRTGEIKLTFNTLPNNSFHREYGWVPMSDGSIGSAASGATTRANADTFTLYFLLWNMVTDAWAPVSGGRGGSAITDFDANKVLYLPKCLGRALACFRPGVLAQTFTASTVTNELTVADATVFLTATPVTLTTSGTLPAPLALATTYYTIYVDSTNVKLATSAANAIAGTFITLTTTGTGTHTITVNFTAFAIGQNAGEEKHVLTIPEIPSHVHGYSGPFGPTANVQAGTDHGLVEFAGGATDPTGGGLGHNTIQPTLFLNVFIKL